MRGAKTQTNIGPTQGRNQIPNRGNSHLTNEGQLRSQPSYSVQGQVSMMMPSRQFMSSHPAPMGIPQRPMRANGRPVYSSSPQGPPLHYNVPQQQNMTYPAMVPQEQYPPQMVRQFIPNMSPYQLSPYQQPYVPQQAQSYYQSVPVMNQMYYVPAQAQGQPQQQQQQQQQQAAPPSAGNSSPVLSNVNKPVSKPKRSNKITIRDPKDNKDVTEEILSTASSHAAVSNGKSGTPPLATSSSQTDSSIQATFARQVAAAAVGDKGHQDKKTELDKNRVEQILKPRQSSQQELIKTEQSLVKTEETEKKLSEVTKTLPQQTEGSQQEDGTVKTEAGVSELHDPNTCELNKAEATSKDSRTVILSSDKAGALTNEKLTTGENNLNNSSAESEPKFKLLKTDADAEVRNVTSENNEAVIKGINTATETSTNKDTEDLGREISTGIEDTNGALDKGAFNSKTEPVSSVTEDEKPSDVSVKPTNHDVENSSDNVNSSVSVSNGFENSFEKRNNVVESEDVSDRKDSPQVVSEPSIQSEEQQQVEQPPSLPEQQQPLQEDPLQQQPQQQQPQQQQPQQQQPQQQQPQQQQPQQQQPQQQQPQQQQPQQQQPQQQQPQQQQPQQQQPQQQQPQQQQPQQQQPQQQQPQQQQPQQQQPQQQQPQQQQPQQQQPQQQQPQQQQPQQQQPQQQLPAKTGDPPKKRSNKQRIKEMNKKESEGNLMDAYMDKPPPPEPVVEEMEKVPEVVAKKPEKPSDEDLSWEDKGEKIGDEIKVEQESEPEAVPLPTEQTKLKYERDFLLQFQFMQVCTEKPAGLPNIEVVLDAPAPQNKIGSQRGADFLPSYARQKSQGGGGRRDSRGKTQPRKIITPVNQPPVELKKSDNRWLRPHEKEQELTEEEKKTAELYRIVVSILNKLTPQKFKTLVEQIRQLDIDTPERLEGVIDRIFEKAISEPVFSVAYANMCRCLFTIKVSGPDEKDVSFRKLLLNRCQKEFEKEKEDEKDLAEKYSQLEGLSEEERKIKKEEMDEEAAKNKRRMLGNIKFIGELFKLKLLTENIMHDCIFKLLRAGDEESLESMCKLLFTIGKDLDSDKAKPRIEQYFEQINKVIVGKKVSSRVCFMLRDVVDLRKNNWVPRREENYNPKTIDQIHKEAQMERTQEARNANLPKEAGKQKKGGGRDSPKMTPASGDGWIVSGKGGKPQPIDHNKLKSMSKRAGSGTDEKISLGPSGRFGQSWGRGSTGGGSTGGNSAQEQEPQGNRFSALSGDALPSNRPYDPRKSSTSRPSSAGSRLGDKRQTKSERDSALDAVRSIVKPQSRAEAPQKSTNAQDVADVKSKMPPDQPQEKEPLTKEEVVKKTKAIVDEFVNIEDLEEARSCFTDLHVPELHHVFVSTSVEHTFDMDSKARTVTGRLINYLLTKGELRKEHFTQGLNTALEFAEDIAIDYPKLWQYLAEILTPIVVGGKFNLLDLKPLIVKHLLACNKAGVLLAEILTIAKQSKGEEPTIALWNDSNISWSDVLPKDVPCQEFLEQKKLQFLPNKIDELKKLLRGDSVSNDKVFSCIEKNFKEKRKEPEFISQLAIAVAESCIVNKDGADGPDCCVERLKARRDILHKYLDNNHHLELEVLFALQTLYVQHNKPTQMLGSFFNTLYDEEVIQEESFLAWKNDDNPSRQEAKGSALQATSSFFDWLQSAAVEGPET